MLLSSRRRGSPWTGLGTVIAKEAADHLGSVRMIVIEVLVFLTALGTAFFAIRTIRETIGESPFLFLRLMTMSPPLSQNSETTLEQDERDYLSVGDRPLRSPEETI